MIKRQTLILIVDDDLSVIASIELLLKQNGYKTLSACNPEEALSKLENNKISLVIQDMNFSRSTSGKEGLELLKLNKNNYSNIPVLLMTAWASIELAVEGIKQGASDFLTKPWDNANLLRVIETALELNKPSRIELSDRKELDRKFDFKNIIGQDPLLLEILSTIGRVASTNAPILILGESGTGKELIADAIHNNSLRQEESLVKVNLGGMTTSLFESEMFGHVKGAFTDAKQDRLGRFELADKGSIFLDEIGDLDPASQVKLLRILQDQTFQPVGSSKTRRSNFRVISATNRSLDEMVANNEFREDLLYRLNLITIELPPLRKRKGDISQLANHHLKRIEKQYHLEDLTLKDDAIKWLEKQAWPGNIRQLSQTIERVVLMSHSKTISEADLINISPANSAQLNHSNNIEEIENLTLNELEKVMIMKSLDVYKNNITKVSEVLGVSRSALYRRLEKYGINL
ncbi:MAG: sigma-54-dependent Fis family transcriptional regulator [Kangiella sp.]|nr:MAG: sigma-54-dependent Fis family transcriptional regulator [Kangiella sp.]